MDLNAGASPDLMNQNLIKDMRTVFSFIGKYYKRKIVNGEKKVFVVLASGNLHCGHLDDRGLRTGLGIGILRNGDIYEGNFDGDRFSGYGELRSGGGCVYRGEFSAGLRDGQGSQTYPNGDFYCGQFRCGQRSGRGRCEYGSGGSYEGEYLADRRHGAGVFIATDGSRFEGRFQFGKKCGVGLLTYGNGDEYAGEFRDDLKHGIGKYRYADGSEYEGSFVNGLAHGKGTIKRPVKGVKGGFLTKDGVWEQGLQT